MNGNSPFRPFASNNHIPILWQAFTVKGGFSTVMLQCGCSAKEPIMLVGSNPGACQSCGNMYAVAEFGFTAQTGQIQTKVAIGKAGPQPVEVEPVGIPS